MKATKRRETKSTKRIVIVEPISSGLMLIDEAKSMGIEVIVASFDCQDRCLEQAFRERVDGLIVVDTNDETALMEAIVKLAYRVRVDAVLPGFEYFVPAVSRVNAKLQLPGLPLESVDAVRIKSLMRERLKAHGVRVPAYATAASLPELESAALNIGFPAVLKPLDSAGSVHVSRVDSMEELRKAFAALRAETRTDLSRKLSNQVQLEAYIDGPEFSVEGFVVNGIPQIVSITEKLLGSEPHFVELGHIVGSALPQETEKSIQNYVFEVVVALGVIMGPFHCEIRLGHEGPVTIELAARLPGDLICELISLTRGVSLPRAMIDAYLGQASSAVDIALPVDNFAGIHFFTAPELTYYTEVAGLEKIENLPGFVKYGLTIQPKEHIPPLTDFRGRLGFTIFTAPTYEEIRDRLTTAAHLITFT